MAINVRGLNVNKSFKVAKLNLNAKGKYWFYGLFRSSEISGNARIYYITVEIICIFFRFYTKTFK
jgi:hypothetical protein